MQYEAARSNNGNYKLARSTRQCQTESTGVEEDIEVVYRGLGRAGQGWLVVAWLERIRRYQQISRSQQDQSIIKSAD